MNHLIATLSVKTRSCNVMSGIFNFETSNLKVNVKLSPMNVLGSTNSNLLLCDVNLDLRELITFQKFIGAVPYNKMPSIAGKDLELYPISDIIVTKEQWLGKQDAKNMLYFTSPLSMPSYAGNVTLPISRLIPGKRIVFSDTQSYEKHVLATLKPLLTLADERSKRFDQTKAYSGNRDAAAKFGNYFQLEHSITWITTTMEVAAKK